MSSAGFRVLLGTMKAARENRGDLRLASVRDNVLRVLQKVGFDRFMAFYDDVDAALGSFE